LRGIIALIGLLGGKGKVEEAARRGEDRGGAWSVKQGKGKGRKEGGRGADPTCGVPVSAAAGKKKRRRERRPLREKLRWAGGLKGKEVPFFPFFFFQTLFKLNLINSNSNQTFSIFFTTLYKPFRLHTSNHKPRIAK
jgi:hypothetical protein